MFSQDLLFKYYIMPKKDYDDENVNNLKKDPFDDDDDRDDDDDDRDDEEYEDDWDEQTNYTETDNDDE